jgi:hypothetical protein
MSHEVHIGNGGVQSNDQETSTPKPCTQGGLETINLDEEIGSAPAVKTPKIRFQPNEDELLIQSWFNIPNDSIVGVDSFSLTSSVHFPLRCLVFYIACSQCDCSLWNQ